VAEDSYAKKKKAKGTDAVPFAFLYCSEQGLAFCF